MLVGVQQVTTGLVWRSMSVVACFLRMTAISLSNLRPAIYCRKSEESEERQVLSLPAQRDEAMNLIAKFGFTKAVHYEESKSAKFSGQRRQFTQMMRDIRSGKINAIICWKLDRLARNMVEGGQIIDLLQEGVIKVIITPFKTYTPKDNTLLMAVEFGAAKQFSVELSENIIRGLAKKANNGCPPARATIGFLNNRLGGKGERKWMVDNERLPIIRQIFQMYLSGNYSGTQIYRWATETAKLTTVTYKRSGNKLISCSAIYTLLRNPIYAGFFYVQGERYVLKNLPHLITESEHYRILQMLSGNTAPKTQKHHAIYTGYIKSPQGEFVGPDIKMQLICDCKHKFAYAHKTNCPKCRAEISKLKAPKYLYYVYYRNVAKAKQKTSKKYISETEITRQLVTYIKSNLILSPFLVDWCKAYYRKELLNDRLSEFEEIESNRKKRIKELEAKKVRCREMLADAIFSKEEYQNDVEKINAELASMQDYSTHKEWLIRGDEILTIGSRIVDRLENGSFKDKKEMVDILGSNLFWDEKNLIIVYPKEIQRVIDGLNEATKKNIEFEPKNTLADRDQTGVFVSVIPILSRMLQDVRNILT